MCGLLFSSFDARFSSISKKDKMPRNSVCSSQSVARSIMYSAPRFVASFVSFVSRRPRKLEGERGMEGWCTIAQSTLALIYFFTYFHKKEGKKKTIEKYVLPIRRFGSLKTSAYVFFVRRPLAISFLLGFFSECFSYVRLLSWTIEWDQSSERAMG
jgi:hypothetical protein